MNQILGHKISIVLCVVSSTSIVNNISKVQTSATIAPNSVEFAQRVPKFHPQSPDNPNYLVDYDFSTPLPQTGKVTIRGNIRELNFKRLFARCPAKTSPFAFAESTNYLVQICSKENDLQIPKYYIGRAKNGSGSIRITNTNEDEVNYLVFKNAGYTYSIYQDGGDPERVNAYLEVTRPDGKTYAEALLYMYDRRW